MFLSEEENSLTKEYLLQGYIIRPVADKSFGMDSQENIQFIKIR